MFGEQKNNVTRALSSEEVSSEPEVMVEEPKEPRLQKHFVAIIRHGEPK